MKKNKNNDIHNLERLINITKSIYKLYYEKTNNNNSNKIKQYLDLAIEVENEIYYSLNINTQNYSTLISDAKRLLNKFHYQNLINEEEKDAIEVRIENTIINTVFENPYLSTKTNYNERITEEYTIIRNQAENEYYNNLLYFLLENINNTKSKKERKRLLEMYNMILFERKTFEKTQEINLKNNSRQKCILFNHNEELINKVYTDFLFSTAKNFIINCLTYTDLDLENHKYRVEQNLRIQFLKSTLSLLTKEEKENLLLIFGKEFLSNREYDNIRTLSSNSTTKIINTIKQATMKENKQNTKKQKI